MTTHHLIRVTRTVTTKSSVVLELPVAITPDDVRDHLKSGGTLPAPMADKDGPVDWRADYVADGAGTPIVRVEELAPKGAFDEGVKGEGTWAYAPEVDVAPAPAKKAAKKSPKSKK